MAERTSSNLYYSYKEEKYSKRGVRSLRMSLLSIGILIVITALSVAGISSQVTGAIGFTGMVVAFMGIVEGLTSFHDAYVKSYAVSKLGTVLSGLVFALWFVIYCIGISL